MENLSRYQKAALVWLDQNPGKTLADCLQKEKVMLETGEEVALGSYLNRIKTIYRAMQEGKRYGRNQNLTSTEIKWWSEHGLSWEPSNRGRKLNIESYQKAALVWLDQNPGKTLADCLTKEKVILDTGEEVALGRYLSRIKTIYRAMQKGKKYGTYQNLTSAETEWWSEHGLSWELCNREENIENYQKAALVWLDQNPGKTLADCLQKEKVTLETGEEVALGSYLKRIKTIYRAMQKGKKYGTYQNLTSAEIKWWSEHGLFGEPSNRRQERNIENYRKAAFVWLEQNPDKTLRDCPQKEKVILETGEEVALGSYLHRIRMIYRAMQKGEKYGCYLDLTDEEIKWWSERGLSWEPSNRGRKANIESYQKAALVWLEQNPGKTLADCLQKEKVTLETGEEVALGSYLKRIKTIYRAMQKGKKCGTYQNLTSAEIKWWSEHGLSWEPSNRRQERNIENYRKAALAWLEQNPDKTLADCLTNEKVILETGEEVALGRYLSRIKTIYRAMQNGKKYGTCRNLTSAETEWWSKHGMVWELSKRRGNIEKYQKAALVWLEQNPDKTLHDCLRKEKVALETGEEVALGRYLSRIRYIYQAMQRGEKYGCYLNLTGAEIKWWSEHGLSWELSNSGRKKNIESYRKAALVWLEQNPDKTLRDCPQKEKVILETGEEVALGSYLNRIRCIYQAMQRGEKYSRYLDLPDAEIDWWSKHGMSWELSNRWWNAENCQETAVKQGENLEKSVVERMPKAFNTSMLNRNVLSQKSIFENVQKHLESVVLEDWLVDIFVEIIKQYNSSKNRSEENFMRITERIVSEYLLNLSEKKLLYEHLRDYFSRIKEIDIIRVGWETNENKKIAKIQKYGLDEFDIEESFFTFLKNEKDEVLRKKYELLRSYIIDWNYYSIEAKKKIQRQNGFGMEDMQYIEDTRKQIDELVQKVKELRK